MSFADEWKAWVDPNPKRMTLQAFRREMIAVANSQQKARVGVVVFKDNPGEHTPLAARSFLTSSSEDAFNGENGARTNQMRGWDLADENNEIWPDAYISDAVNSHGVWGRHPAPRPLSR